AEPLERGFGTTLGNSLRRVLLSSLEGSAISSVRISGAQHEFSSVPGVIEDTTDLILNLKEIRLKLHTDKVKTLSIKTKGPGEVTAKDIEADAEVEILNPGLHIATIDKNGKLEMEMRARRGRGYVPSEKNKEPGQPIGVIPIDSIFSPIRKVNFKVENARVGQETDFDKLVLEVTTDGSIRPDDAVAHAAKLLKDHLSFFIHLPEEEEIVMAEEEIKKSPAFNENLLRSVSELELSVRAANCLKNAGIETISEMVQKTESEMLKTKNFGRKSLNEIKEILTEMGLGLGLKVDDTIVREARKLLHEKPTEG
ncbi:MAG TPA: DNA-directed RNA polymerase subunit alpha, partial [Nitrospiraceae bacterium]|nr:DNA-directed RNA polymerase subunit alpha [Nitrospiraceae bacterium]